MNSEESRIIQRVLASATGKVGFPSIEMEKTVEGTSLRRDCQVFCWDRLNWRCRVKSMGETQARDRNLEVMTVQSVLKVMKLDRITKGI